MPLLPCHYLTWRREQCLQSHAPCRQTTGNEGWHSSACSVRCAKQFVEFQRHLSNRRNTWLQLPGLYMSNKYFYDSLQFSRPESRGFITHKIKKPLLWSFIQWMKAFRAQLQHTLKYFWTQPRTITKPWLASRSFAGGHHTASWLILVGKQQFTQAKNGILLHMELFFVNHALIHIWEPDNKHFR